MQKKGDISLQVIIIAILGLLVLVILSVMFITKMGTANQNLDACEAKGGACRVDGCLEYETRDPFAKCADEATTCCLGKDTSNA